MVQEAQKPHRVSEPLAPHVLLSASSSRFTELLLVVATSAYLFGSLFSIRGVPYLLGGDQVYFWMNAMRMQQGALIYRDFFQFTPPGTDILYFLAFKTFGPRIWVTNAIVLCLGVILVWLCYRIARTLVDSTAAALASGLFLVVIYAKLLNATHHWFSLLSVMLAIWILLPRRTLGRIASAGALLGLAAFFTQTRGPLAILGIIGFLIWECARVQEAGNDFPKRALLLIASAAAVWLSFSAYFMASVGLSRLWCFQVIYVTRYMGAELGYLGLPGPLTSKTLPSVGPVVLIYALLPLVYGFVLLRHWKDSSVGTIDRAVLIAFVGTALLLEVAWSPNWLRVYCVAMPAIILLVWVFVASRRRRQFAWIAWIPLICVAVQQVYSRHGGLNTSISTPGGALVTSDIIAEKLTWLGEHVTSQNGFFQAAWPGMYLPLQTGNPLYIDSLSTTNQTRPKYVESAIEELRTKRVRYILWSKRLDGPSADGPQAYHLTAFKDFLRSSYALVHEFPDGDSVWEIKEQD